MTTRRTETRTDIEQAILAWLPARPDRRRTTDTRAVCDHITTTLPGVADRAVVSALDRLLHAGEVQRRHRGDTGRDTYYRALIPAAAADPPPTEQQGALFG